jgi:hypothetical protein
MQSPRFVDLGAEVWTSVLALGSGQGFVDAEALRRIRLEKASADDLQLVYPSAYIGLTYD